jgi:hypothetical protein
MLVRPLLLAIFIFANGMIVPSLSQGASPFDAVAQSLEKSVLPAIEERCLDCHDAEMRKGDVNLETLWEKSPKRHDIRLWDKIREQLRAGTMPPKEKPQLEPAAKLAIIEWVKQNEAATLAAPANDPGSRKSRRLTREEYSNTLRDLLGISERPGDKFPADGSGGEGFTNNADTLTMSPLLIEKHLEGAESAITEVWKKPELKHRLLAPCTSDKLAPEVGAEIIARPFLLRAYRRPVTDDEVKEVLAVFSAALKRNLGWDGSLRVMFKAVLTSPKFLFIDEARHADAKEPWAVDDFELASRLSYFLWSSMPDEELMKLAGEKKLRDDVTLAAQTRRLLADEKARAFTKNFGGQWLHFEEVYNTVDPDRRKFPEFNDTIRRAMHDQAFAFMDVLLRQDGRVLDILQSDYTFLNEALSKFYGLPLVTGPDMQRVKLPDTARGGIVGMGAILAYSAYPQRTSPVLRGKWVLETLLGTPPPPPPENVGSLPEDDRDLKGKTLRQRLEAHREKPACVGCHARMDPIGFALENLDAVGRWRDQENGKPVDSVGQLLDGRTFRGPAELSKVLIEEKDKFTRTLCSRLLGYALNRGLEVSDQPTLLRLEEALRKNDYRSESLIVALVQSPAFRTRRP